MGTDLIPMNTLKGAIHYRRDIHTEQSIYYYDTTTAPSTLLSAEKRQAEERGRSQWRTRSTPRASSISLPA